MELENRGFGLATDAFLKSVKKFLDKEVSVMPNNNRSPVPHHTPVICYFTMLGYIFGIDCQTTLQVKEKLISRLPVEIYVQLLCLIFVSGYWAT